MKIIPISVVLLSLAGCAGPQEIKVEVPRIEVAMPPSNLLKCGSVKLPDSFKDNKEVADSYVKLWKHNQFCHNNMEAVKKYLDSAKKDLTSGQ